MKISKKDALEWFEFLLSNSEEGFFKVDYEEIVCATFSQIENAVENRRNKLLSEIINLRNLENRTIYTGDPNKFSKGCQSCLFGNGLGAIRKTNKCNLECKFCYYYGKLDSQRPVGESMWDIGGTKYYEKDIDILLSIHDIPSGIAYVYLEPFIEIEKYYSVIKKFSNAKIYQHLYTNGTLATEDNLKLLGEAGLDEIRFNLGATDCSDRVIENIKLAKKYIKYVGIETPMTPEFFNSFFEKKRKILDTKLDFINCAELHLCETNIRNYYGENMYISREGYISPIWSRDLTLKLMKIAAEECWDIVVHDCSNNTKFARHLNQAFSLGLPFGASSYSSEFSRIPLDIFLPLLKDVEFNFVEEEELPSKFNLNNIKILSR